MNDVLADGVVGDNGTGEDVIVKDGIRNLTITTTNDLKNLVKILNEKFSQI